MNNLLTVPTFRQCFKSIPKKFKIVGVILLVRMRNVIAMYISYFTRGVDSHNEY